MEEPDPEEIPRNSPSRRIKTDAYFEESFRHLDEELAEVLGVLSTAIPLPPEIRHLLDWDAGSLECSDTRGKEAQAAQLHSVAFELLNLVEQRVAFQFRSWRRSHYGPASVSGLWPQVIQDLAARGHSEKEALDALKKVHVEPVLTAHPTEAKRGEVREKHLAIDRRLVEWEGHRSDPHWARQFCASLGAELEALWLTGEIFIQRPRVSDELRNAIHYLRDVFPDVVMKLDRSLEFAWQDAGWSVENLRAAEAWPRISFATWIGGDRDGHPFVTPEVTAETLYTLRANAIRLHRRWLNRNARELTLAPPFARVPPGFSEAIATLAASLGEAGAAILDLFSGAPWRVWLLLVREKLALAPDRGGYPNVAGYLDDLILAREALEFAGATRAIREWIAPLTRLAQVFGFHLAALDVRQNSEVHDEAAADILRAADIPDAAGFANWPESRRRALLEDELRNPRPLLAPNQSIDGAAARVIEPLRVLAAHSRTHGTDGLGQLIISMTRECSDLLLVHLFCREAGLARRDESGLWRSEIPVSPLFETGDDLDRSAEVLTDYLSIMGPSPSGRQPVMVGYSDSNKDAGVIASQWGIRKAQQHIVEACRAAGVTPHFFHGRGGTIGRGAGPTHWFLRSLPPGSLQGPIRLTEQGEVLPRKYADDAAAHYHMEALVAGVSGKVCSGAESNLIAPEHRESLDLVAEKSAETYRDLLRSESFLDFFRSATPIDALEAGNFGSRPPRRTGAKGATIEDLRAIPWVFSWTQARFYLPGWFGVGSGLHHLQESEPDAYDSLIDSLPSLPFLRYVLTNVESTLASANLEIMSRYALLCEDESLRRRILEIVRAEFDLTRAQLAAFFRADFSTRRPRLCKTLSLREVPLRHLHEQQIFLLRRWRKAGRPVESKPGRYDRTYLALQLTINALSSGLRETG